MFPRRQDDRTREGVRLGLGTPCKSCPRCYQVVSSRILTGEFLTKVGLLLVVVVYAPTDHSSTEDKDLFYSDLESVTTNASGLVIAEWHCSVCLARC